MAFYWKVKRFPFNAGNRSAKEKEIERWQEKHASVYQMREIFCNNAYALEYRDLVKL